MASTTPSPDSDIIFNLPNNITIRRYRLSDASSLSHHGTGQAVSANLSGRMPQPYTEADATFWINFNADPANHVPSGTWDDTTRTSSGPSIPASYAIAVNDVAVGTIGLDFGDPNFIYRRSASIGYWLGEEFWGKGVMSAVARAFVEWAWGTLGVLVRLNGSAFVENQASARVLRKAGFEFEGRRRAFAVKDGVVRGENMFGIVRPGLVIDH